ncbi:MAG TPA: hypothetical protein PLS10_08275, partial [Chitinophagales bacterium]|nr:hypothetical protein [Chitinophagales bacterium]
MKKTISLILFITLFHISFSQSYKEQLKKVNDYLKTFDNGYYGYLEIKDGYLYDRFPSGKYTKSLMNDLSNAEVETYNQKVRIKCKNDGDCVFSTYTDSYHKQLSFSQSASFNTSELVRLLNDFLDAYNNKSTITNTNNSSDLDKYKSNIDILNSGSSSTTKTLSSYQSALDKLNAYLKKFDNGYYGYFEVKDGYIYDRFKAGKYNKFKMEDMEGAVIQEQYNRVIFKCKGDNKCISTDWKE